MLSQVWLRNGDDWFYLGADGRMLTGLVAVSNGTPDDGLYYFDPEPGDSCGTMLTGWQTIDGSRYYFETRHNGSYGRAYADGTYTIGGRVYIFDRQGRLVR